MWLSTVQRKAKAFFYVSRYVSNVAEIYLHLFQGRPLREIRLRNGIIIDAPEKLQLWNHFNDIWLHQTYTSGGYEIENGSTVIDIGANIGIFSLFASFRAGKVFSFEPFPLSYRYLVENIERSQVSNIQCFSYAVCAEPGTRDFYPQNELTANTLFGNYNSGESKSTIECITLQRVFEDNEIGRCDFLKLDCEGSEFEIILETPKSYLKRVGIISMEVHNDVTQYTHVHIQNYLEKLGFETYVALDRESTVIVKAKNVGENLHD